MTDEPQPAQHPGAQQVDGSEGSDRRRPVARDQRLQGGQHVRDGVLTDGRDARPGQVLVRLHGGGHEQPLVEFVDADRQHRVRQAGDGQRELVAVALDGEHCPDAHQLGHGLVGAEVAEAPLQ
jgi:hypothetical protein